MFIWLFLEGINLLIIKIICIYIYIPYVYIYNNATIYCLINAKLSLDYISIV